MDDLERRIIDVIGHYDSLTAWYRKRLKELAQEYEYGDDLIRMVQLKSPGAGGTPISGGGGHRGLDDVHAALQRRSNAYQQALYQEMVIAQTEYQRVQAIHFCFQALPQEQQEILRLLYADAKSYKEITSPGLSHAKIARLRKKGIETIKQNYKARMGMQRKLEADLGREGEEGCAR